MSEEKLGFGQELYEDAYKLNLFTTKIYFYAAIVICAGLVLAAIVVKYKHTDYKKKWQDIDATITEAKCNTVQTGNDSKIECGLKLQYDKDSKKYDKQITTSGKYYSNGDKIKVAINNENPTDVSTSTISSFGYIPFYLIIIAIFLIGFAYWNKYLTENFKIYGVTNLIGSMFNLGWGSGISSGINSRVTNGFNGLHL
jgi:hypothetical protein